MTISTIILLAIVLLFQALIFFVVYRFSLKISKIHYIISTNSMDLDKIKKVLLGKESCLSKIEKNVDGIHTMISTPIVKALINKKEE